MKGRYINLLAGIADTVGNSKPHKAYKIMEIGVWRADHALEMIEHAKSLGRTNVEYYGFDLFEKRFLALPLETRDTEISKSKPPLSVVEVKNKLTSAGVKVVLFEGLTRDTLPAAEAGLPLMDLIFVDGGHSIDTIANDWVYVCRLMHSNTVVLFDDYYYDRRDAGCKSVVDRLSVQSFKVDVLEPRDVFDHTKLSINMVRVTLQG